MLIPVIVTSTCAFVLLFLLLLLLRSNAAKSATIASLETSVEDLHLAFEVSEARLGEAGEDLKRLQDSLVDTSSRLEASRKLNMKLEESLLEARATNQELTQSLKSAIKERDFARKTSTRQTAKMDSILEAIDPSGALAEEVAQGK